MNNFKSFVLSANKDEIGKCRVKILKEINGDAFFSHAVPLLLIGFYLTYSPGLYSDKARLYLPDRKTTPTQIRSLATLALYIFSPSLI